MSDPLSLIRQATVTGTPVGYSDGNYIFGEYKFHESVKTFFKRTLKSSDYYYTLKDIIFFLENAEISVADYRRKAVEARIVAVVEQDRQALKNYLTGVVEICPQIDLAAAASFVKSSSSAPNVEETAGQPGLSLEKLQEQRQRHAAMLEKQILKSKAPTTADQATFSTDKLEELRNLRKAQKRKLTTTPLGTSQSQEQRDEEVLDQAYIEADRQVLARLRQDETPSHTRSTILKATDIDFAAALKLFNDRILKPAAAAVSKNPNHPSKPTERPVETKPRVLDNGEVVAPAVRPGEYPIIIVPNAVTSCITTINAKDLLVDGVYVTADAKKQAGAKREREQTIMRPLSGGGYQKFKIIDDPLKLSSSEWSRVVAVFATGQVWQFKGWKQSNPVQLFQQMLGVHLQMDDQTVNTNIQSWNCKVMKLNLFKQHLNAAAAKEFWVALDDFMRLHKIPSHASK